jgi:DNA invertase Pin-like site-specific DNA recombinase
LFFQAEQGIESLSAKRDLCGHAPGRLAEGMPVQTALYLRVSTTQQKPDLQDDGLRAYAARAGLEIVTTYADYAVSGRQESRPQLQALMRAARQHAFACVLVWKFDRFARSVAHLLRALEEFDYLGIRFISVQDQVDTASPMGKAMFTIIGAMAELESALISERVKAGMAAAKARGKRLGRPATPRHVVTHIEEIARTTQLSIRQIHEGLAGQSSRSVVGQIVKRVRQASS